MSSPFAQSPSLTSSVLSTSLADLPGATRARSSSEKQGSHDRLEMAVGGARGHVEGNFAFLRMGDLVALHSSEFNGFLCSEGFTDPSCSLRSPEAGHDAPKDFVGEAVFEVLPRFRYESRSALLRYQESRHYSPDDEEDETLVGLQRDRDEENRDNNEESQRWYGVRIRYGQVIQLRHRQSGKFLGVTVKEVARVEKQNLRVVLEDGSEECRWIFNPRFKVRSEGEEIHTRDQMLLLNGKYHFYLHVSASASVESGLKREVNAAADLSTWSVCMYAPFTSGVSTHALRAGDVIQLFHREQECFLSKAAPKQVSIGSAAPFGNNAHGANDEPDQAFLIVPDEMSKGKILCHDSNSFWTVEFDNPLKGGVCTFGGVFRFRHVATGLYLCGSKASPQRLAFLGVASSSQFHVSVTADRSSAESVFVLRSLNPADRPGDPVLESSFFVLLNQACKMYVGAGERIASKDPKSPLSLTGISDDDEGNAFVFRPVPSRDVSMLHDAVGKVRFLSQFVKFQAQRQQEMAKLKRRQQQGGAGAGMLTARDAAAGNQVGVMSKGLLEMLKSLISSLESHAEDRLLVVARQNLLRDQNALVLLIRLLETIFDKETGVSLENLPKAENFTLNQIVTHIYRLLELLLRDNAENQARISRKSHFIQSHLGFIEDAQETLMLLFKDNPALLHNITEKQMNFFLDLIQTKGKESGFIRFLPILCSIGSTPLSSNQSYLATKFLSADAGFFPKFKHSDGSAEVFILLPELGSDWVALEELEAKCSQRLNDYIIGSIDLLACLCMGRNSAVVQSVSKAVSMSLVMTALRLPRLNAGLRASFANVLLHTYIDADPQKVRPPVSFTRVWLHLDKSLVTASFNDEFASVKKLCQLFLEHVSEKDANQMPMFSLLLFRILGLVYRMFEFGIYQEVNELQDILPHLSRVLGLKSQTRAVMRSTRDTDAMLIEAKLKACQILDKILYFRLNTQITKLLVILKEQLEVRVVQSMDIIVTTVLARLSFENEDHMSKVLSLFHYDYPPLSTMAANLLIRHNTQRAILVDAFKQVQVLVSDESVKTYERVQKLVEQLRVLGSGDIDDDNVGEVLDVLKQWIVLCKDPEHRCENQRILFNLSAHTAVIKLCQNPFHDIGVEDETNINTYAFHFLMHLCKGNSKNQTELFEHFDFFATYLDRVPRVAELLAELVRNNARNIMLISERQIQNLVNFVALGHQQARFLECLMATCTLNGSPVRRNQVMVMRLVLEQGKQTLVLFNDPESKAERNVMIRAGEYRDPHHVINYHIALLELLTTCCQGRIYEAEIKAQSLYSFEEILMQLTDPSNLWAIKGRMVNFMCEVYFEAERIGESVEFQSSLWEIFGIIIGALELYPTLDAELRKDDGYRYFVFNAVFPFLRVYFTSHYDHSRAQPEHQALVHRLCNELLSWLRLDIVDSADGKAVCAVATDVLKHIGPALNASASASIGVAGVQATRSGFGTPLVTHKSRTGVSAGKLGQSGGGGLASSGGRSANNSGKMVPVEQMQKAIETWRSTHEVSISTSATLSSSSKAPDSKDEGIHGEMRAFAKLLKHGMDLQQEMQQLAGILQAQMSTDITGIIISILSSKISMTEGQTMVLLGLRGMRLIMESNSFGGADRSELQNKFNELKATQMMLQLLNSEDELVQFEALNFGIALLFGGNTRVQQSILDHFTDTADAEWFHEFRRHIRRLAESVKSLFERQAVLVGQDEEGKKQQKELRFKCEMLQRCFRFLQLLCEGHFTGLQHFLRAQANNSKSYDLVTETVEILEHLERCIDDKTVGVMSQLWISLTEYIQGPCQENQNVLISTKLCESANFLLEDELALVTETDARQELKEEVLLTLLSIMEGHSSPQVAMHLLRTLDFHVLRRNLARLWAENNGQVPGALGADGAATAVAKGGAANTRSQLGMLEFRYYALLVTLRDFEQDNRIFPQVTMIETVAGFEHMERLVGRIEILRHERLERVYFPIPDICKSIAERDKRHILWSVERSTQQQKIESFFKLSNHVISELKHLEEVRKDPVFAVLNQRQSMLQSASFFLALLINLVIVLGYHAPRENADASLRISAFTSLFLFLMGLVQVVFAGLMLVGALVGSWKLLVIRGWEQEGEMTVDFGEIVADRGKLMRSVYFVFRDPGVLYRTVYLFFGLLGVIVPDGYFFFAVHLFDMVVRNDILKSVLKSISFNWKQLVMTASFTSIVVYCYSIIGFLFFRKAFFINEETLDCETMLQCTVMVLYRGLRNGGGIGDVLRPPVWEEPRTFLRILYDTSFWIICILILLNSFLGIIIDTFGELRSKDQAIIEDIESKCFLCGVDRHRFDRLTAGFDIHIKYDHNMWHYLYFNVHLRRTEETEYTGPESFVSEMLAQQDLTFIPNQRAICLESQTKDKGATSQLSLELEMLRGQSDDSIKDMEIRFAKNQDEFQDKLIELSAGAMNKISDLIVSQNKVVDTRMAAFESRLNKMEAAVQRALASAAVAARSAVTSDGTAARTAEPSSGAPTAAVAGLAKSGTKTGELIRSGSKSLSSSASGKPPTDVLNKYTKASAPPSSDDSDDSVLEVLRRGTKKSPNLPSKPAASATGPVPAALLNKYTAKKAASSSSDSDDSALEALNKKKTPEKALEKSANQTPSPKPSASGPASAELMSKYTAKKAASSSDSDDSALEALNKKKPEPVPMPVASASGAPPASLMSKYTSKQPVASSSDADDSALEALTTKKTEPKAEPAAASASGTPSADVMSKYTSKKAVFSSDSDDSALEALTTKKTEPKAEPAAASASGTSSADVMSKYTSKKVASSSSDSDSALEALNKKSAAAPAAARPVDVPAKVGGPPSPATGSDSEGDLAAPKTPARNNKKKSMSGNSDSDEPQGPLKTPSSLAMSRSAMKVSSNFLLSPATGKGAITPEDSGEEISLDPDRAAEAAPLPDWTYKDEASDDDWMGDERSASGGEDDEEQKKKLAAYMSQGSGMYKATQQLK